MGAAWYTNQQIAPPELSLNPFNPFYKQNASPELSHNMYNRFYKQNASPELHLTSERKIIALGVPHL